MIKRIRRIDKRRKLISKIKNLDIKESGIDSEGDVYVQLVNGLTFFGDRSQDRLDSLLYRELPSKVKKVLGVEALRVAIDIVIRYEEGGLMYGGPKKQSRYKVKTGDFVSEMGAYQGFCSMKLAEQVGESGKVICIEPMPDNFRLLTKNIKSNGFKQVICINKAVWHEPTRINFNRRKNDGQSSSIEMEYEDSDVFTVQADTLDNIYTDIGFKPIDFVIIQLNGAEINGLRGLTSFHPKNLSIAARYDTEDVDAAQAIEELLISRGYRVEIDREDFVFANLDTE